MSRQHRLAMPASMHDLKYSTQRELATMAGELADIIIKKKPGRAEIVYSLLHFYEMGRDMGQQIGELRTKIAAIENNFRKDRK